MSWEAGGSSGVGLMGGWASHTPIGPPGHRSGYEGWYSPPGVAMPPYPLPAPGTPQPAPLSSNNGPQPRHRRGHWGAGGWDVPERGTWSMSKGSGRRQGRGDRGNNNSHRHRDGTSVAGREDGLKTHDGGSCRGPEWCLKATNDRSSGVAGGGTGVWDGGLVGRQGDARNGKGREMWYRGRCREHSNLAREESKGRGERKDAEAQWKGDRAVARFRRDRPSLDHWEQRPRAERPRAHWGGGCTPQGAPDLDCNSTTSPGRTCNYRSRSPRKEGGERRSSITMPVLPPKPVTLAGVTLLPRDEHSHDQQGSRRYADTTRSGPLGQPQPWRAQRGQGSESRPSLNPQEGAAPRGHRREGGREELFRGWAGRPRGEGREGSGSPWRQSRGTHT
ncbi:unnamed protein product, partial [Discosporangium mesarthrocarpum]